MLVSKFPSNIDAKPFSYGSITVTELHDDLPLDTTQETSSDFNEISYTPPISINFAKEVEHFQQSFEILEVLEKYGRHLDLKAPTAASVPNTSSQTASWSGKHKFLPHVYHHVQQAQPIQLTMPAFPCKSLNKINKVIGHLPDLGEELALSRLHAMGQDIQRVYAPGANINIASDGVLFNDILGITDEDCWDYGEALKDIISEKGFTTLTFTRCMSLLGLLSEKDINRETYLASADICRRSLERQFAPSEDSLTKSIKTDKDTGLTYCGMVKFLQSEMESSPELIGQANAAKIRTYKRVAKRMMQRSEAFTMAIRSLNPHHVRLSMHPSSGAAKLSIALIPTADGGFQKSPWHSCIAVGLDGANRCVHSEEVRDTHDLVYKHGRPYYYQERASEP